MRQYVMDTHAAQARATKLVRLINSLTGLLSCTDDCRQSGAKKPENTGEVGPVLHYYQIQPLIPFFSLTLIVQAHF